MHIWDFDMSREAVAADVQDLRLAAGLTQQGMADRLGVTRTAVFNWEHRLARPNSDPVLAGLRALAQEIGYA